MALDKLPNFKELVMYVNKALGGIEWNTNFQKIVNWLTSGKYDLKIKSIELSQDGGIVNQGSFTQNGNLTIDGSSEITGNLDVGGVISGDGSKLYNLQTQGVQAFTPFCVNSGNIANGNGDLISATPVTEEGDIVRFTIKFKIGTVDDSVYPSIRATTADGSTFTLDTLNADELAANGTFYYFIAQGQTAVTRLANINIHRQATQPPATINDVWLDTSNENLVCKKCNDAGVWETWNYIPIGKVVVADIGGVSATATITTFDFNQNGYTTNIRTQIYGITGYALNSLVDKSADDSGTVYGPFKVPYLVQIGLIRKAGSTKLYASTDNSNWVKVTDLNINYDDDRIDTDLKSIILEKGLYFKFDGKGAQGDTFVFNIAPLYPETI